MAGVAERTAHIIGAGIAGLASAVALAAKGWSVQVFERSPDLRTTGGGLGITPNGMHALNEIGLGAAVRSQSRVQCEGGVRTPTGRWIARSTLEFVEKRYGESIRALPRLDLVRSLEAALPPGTVDYGAKVSLVATGDATSPAVIQVGDQRFESALLVGADGIRSAIRRAMYAGHPGLKSYGSVSWRAVVPADGLTLVSAETWGMGLRFSILPLPAGKVHFSALARSAVCGNPAAAADGPRPWFGTWHDPIPQLLERAADTVLYFDEIEELSCPIDDFTMGRVALVGDAAHPIAPNVGSANLALEDAVELAHAVRDAEPWDRLRAGLTRYDLLRRPRANRLGRLSRRIGRFAELSSPMAVAVRNSAVWLGGFLPAVVSRGSMDAMVRWSPTSVR